MKNWFISFLWGIGILGDEDIDEIDGNYS